MVTPFLKPLATEGGTLYVFPSVSKDLTRTFVSNDYEFKFSHFVCLNIPDFRSGQPYMIDGSDSDSEPDTLVKGVYLESIGKDGVSWNSDGMGKALAEHFQNYMFNFETAILNGEGDNDDYDPEIMTTVSEKVFFNWMQKVGAIEFNGNMEKYDSILDRTVQYIGNIDTVNTVEECGDSYEELYLHIPSSVGATPSIYFRDGSATDNKNYLNKTYHLNGDNERFIIGRKGSESPYDLDITPIMDIDSGGNVYVGDSGHTIDFRDGSYSNGGGISNMNANSSYNFEFNAVLIYYDFYKKLPDNTKRVSTNLYGILFIDNIRGIAGDSIKDNSVDNTSTSERMGYIERYPKKKESFYGNGNSFALKIDLKIDTLPDATTSVERYKTPNDVVAMSLYEKSLSQLQKCIDLFFEQRTTIQKLEERIVELETMVLGIDKIDTLRGEINRLWDLYDTNGNGTEWQGIVEEQSKKLDSILKGERNIKIQYDTDVLQPGEGIKLNKSINKVVINANNNYKISKFYLDEFETIEIDYISTYLKDSYENACFTSLKIGKNFGVLHIENNGVANKEIVIHINDSECGWTVGQSYKIYLDVENLEFDGDELGITIRTGVEKADSGMEYNQSISIPKFELEGKNLIEIICMGENMKSSDAQFIYLIK